MLLTRAFACALAAASLLPAQTGTTSAVPTPKSHFGHEVNEDRKLLDWDKVVSYFYLLAKSSDRIQVTELGKTTMGRPFIMATIASPRTLQKLPNYREIQRRLADPRITSEDEARGMIQEGKTVVLITCSIHSTEVASTHTAVEFAYRMATQDSPRVRKILDNTIFLLVPSLNPDGVDIVTGWYRSTLGTPYEGTSPPQLYHKYTGHDNNRDWYIFSQAETRLAISKIHNVWHPQIVYDVHQQGPSASRLFVPPWLDPIEPNVDPILVQEMNHIGTGIAMDLTAAGKKGIAVNASYDFWTPARHYQAFHAGMRILTESASARLATPITLRKQDLADNALGYDPTKASWNYPEPWEGGEWHLADIIDYQRIAWESCLSQAAARREDLLRNFYRIGKRQMERKTPYAFAIPARQRDPGATRRLIDTLVFGGVEVEKEADGGYSVRMNQPYSGFAKALLERQKYPDLREYPGGPPRRPYDVTAHTLPLLMGVDVQVRENPLDLRVITPFVGESAGRYSASDTDSWITVNRLWKKGATVWREASSGDFAVTQLGAGWKSVKQPRVGLYQSFVPVMDEGWTRWLLENLEFAYTTVRNPDILAGDLRARFDVLVVPDQSAASLRTGYRKGSMPDEYTGGLGESGARALKQFAEAGGTLIFLNRSTEYALRDLGIKAKDVTEGVPDKELYTPGSLLRVKLAPRHPLGYGLPEEFAIWNEHSPAWDLTEGVPVASYPASGLLASGWLLGEPVIAGKTALAEVPAGGRGRIVLFGMRPQYRAQSYLTAKLLFNAFLLGQ